MCESWSSKMMTLRGQKEAPWPGSELFSIDTYPLLIYGSRKIFPNWNILSLEDFEGRMNAAIERNAFLESELDEKVGGKKMSFSKRTWPRRTWRWRCRGWKTRPGTWGLSWKSSTLKWWDASILFLAFKSWSQSLICFYLVCSVFSSWSCSRRTRSRTTTGRWRNCSKTVIRRSLSTLSSLCTLLTSTWDNWIS